ncbi:hypothetical protein ES703_98665 [subsurface metagenome]
MVTEVTSDQDESLKENLPVAELEDKSMVVSLVTSDGSPEASWVSMVMMLEATPAVIVRGSVVKTIWEMPAGSTLNRLLTPVLLSLVVVIRTSSWTVEMVTFPVQSPLVKTPVVSGDMVPVESLRVLGLV